MSAACGPAKLLRSKHRCREEEVIKTVRRHLIENAVAQQGLKAYAGIPLWEISGLQQRAQVERAGAGRGPGLTGLKKSQIYKFRYRNCWLHNPLQMSCLLLSSPISQRHFESSLPEDWKREMPDITNNLGNLQDTVLNLYDFLHGGVFGDELDDLQILDTSH
ncbi:hypothetical protein RRG08_042477 [Elysia crispata]|uniref:Uncharacterized protein n=1 Tax=Elysia crispata TaxID=231223 RepID=A0AAE1CWL7_9GAST|nr:hypothetical protein RRG08_042477 [Elysia crispata]